MPPPYILSFVLLTSNEGMSLSYDPSKAERMVFPDRYEELRPVMPNVEDLKAISRDTLRTWIRDFLVALWSRFDCNIATDIHLTSGF